MLENTLSNKAVFIAKYWGQKVRCWVNDDSGATGVVGSTFITKSYLPNCYLYLYSLASISDMDAEHICKDIGLYNATVVERDKDCVFVTDDTYTVGFWATGVITMYKDRKPYWKDIQSLYNETISHGYYVGDGSELKYDWVKLRK